jgi:DNA polymerase-1
VRATTLDAYKLLHEGSEALARAEWQGLRIDTDYYKNQHRKLTYRIEKEAATFNDSKLGRYWQHVYGRRYNPGSDDQLRKILYEKKGLKPPKETESGLGSVDEDALALLGIEELGGLVKLRKLTKLRDTYLSSFLREARNGELHPFYHLHLVHSYRSSSSDPNFQNVPEHDEEAKRICQRGIYPRKGRKFKKADFSSLEVNIAACYHKDPSMLKYLRDPGSDMHGDSARDLFILSAMNRKVPEDAWLRFGAKNTFVFAEFYGSYFAECAKDLARHIGMPTEGKWPAGMGSKLADGRFISDHLRAHGITSYALWEDKVKEAERVLWEDRFPVYAQWRKDWYKQYESRGYFDLLTGFRCSGYYSRNQSVNLPVQGAAFHCLLWSFNRVDQIAREERWDSKLCAEVHDDMWLDVHPDEEAHVDATLNRVVSEELPKAWPWIIAPMRAEIKTGPIDGSMYEMK